MFTLKLKYHLLGFPLASASEILFLKNLVKFYSRDSHPKITDDDSGTSEVCRIVNTCKCMFAMRILT